MRPGWSDHKLLTPEKFEDLLHTISDTSTVILLVIDLFDLQGSLLSNLKKIVGKNPVVVAANKIDLLPTDASKHRLISWVYDVVRAHCDLISLKEYGMNVGGKLQYQGWTREKTEGVGVLERKNIHLVSCRNGIGMDDLIASLMQLASLNGNQVSYALSSFSKCMYNLIVWTNHMCGVMTHVQNNTTQHENCHMNL